MSYARLQQYDVKLDDDAKTVSSENDTLLGDAPVRRSAAWQVIEDIPHMVPSFEGLRGIAVIMTQWCHVGSHNELIYLGAGGVSIFFVLSGFLITGVLTKLQTSNHTKKGSARRTYSHLLRFYNDRSVRLYPALFLMVALTSLYKYYWTRGNMPPNSAKDALITLTYMTDMRVYLDWSSPWYPNTWSLGVEEKFYIVWSLLLPFICRMTSRAKTASVCLLIAASFALHLTWYLTDPDPYKETIFLGRFTPLQHFWKMLLGAALRLLPTPVWIKKWCCTWIGLAIVALPVILEFSCGGTMDISAWSFPPRNTLSFEILWDICAAAGAVLIICGSLGGNWLLELHPLRFVGRVSYAFYLWQLPLLLITVPKTQPQILWEHGYNGIGTTCIAFVCAVASTVYVEEPLRNKYRAWKAQRDGAGRLPCSKH